MTLGHARTNPTTRPLTACSLACLPAPIRGPTATEIEERHTTEHELFKGYYREIYVIMYSPPRSWSTSELVQVQLLMADDDRSSSSGQPEPLYPEKFFSCDAVSRAFATSQRQRRRRKDDAIASGKRARIHDWFSVLLQIRFVCDARLGRRWR